MSIKLGNIDVSYFKVGGDDCSIYLGTTLVYSGGTPPTPHDYSQDYLTFRATEDGTFSFSGSGSISANTLEYSVDSGSTWSTLQNSGTTPTVTSGNTILWKASGLTISSIGIGKFSSTGQFEAEGNIMSLHFGDNFSGQTSLSGISNAFSYLFQGCTRLTTAENLVLLATTLANSCYSNMFSNCSSLTTAPELPATTLADSCYYSMFYGCSGLTTAPSVLPATTLAEGCYTNMFRRCTSLTTAPVLSATTLADNCYSKMFYGCTSLTTTPVLSATTLADNCYSQMFLNCTSLTTTPVLSATTLANYCCQEMFLNCTSLTTAPSVLPATTLAEGCYYSMFQGCTSLTTAPSVLPATTLAEGCYTNMFRNCSSLTTAPVLPATTLVNRCYSNMFRSCTSLNNITCLARDISAQYCTTTWVQGVAANGIFTKAASMTGWTEGTSGIPSGWTVVDYSS